MDIGELFGNVKNSLEQSWTDFQRVGAPALEASLEQWGIDTLTGMKKQSQAAVDTNVKEILNRPPSDGLGRYFNDVLKQPLVQQYGGITIGIAAIVAVGAVLLFKK